MKLEKSMKNYFYIFYFEFTKVIKYTDLIRFN